MTDDVLATVLLVVEGDDEEVVTAGFVVVVVDSARSVVEVVEAPSGSGGGVVDDPTPLSGSSATVVSVTDGLAGLVSAGARLLAVVGEVDDLDVSDLDV